MRSGVRVPPRATRWRITALGSYQTAQPRALARRQRSTSPWEVKKLPSNPPSSSMTERRIRHPHDETKSQAAGPAGRRSAKRPSRASKWPAALAVSDGESQYTMGAPQAPALGAAARRDEP